MSICSKIVKNRAIVLIIKKSIMNVFKTLRKPYLATFLASIILFISCEQNSLDSVENAFNYSVHKELIETTSAVDINKGKLLWQLPTQSSRIYESAFSLQSSDIITDKQDLFISNNKNQLFSIDIKTGSFNWENKVNSNLRSTIIGSYLFSVSLEGYLIIIEKKSGNIVRVTDVFKNFKIKKRSNIKPTGFVVGLKNIYLSTSNGRLIVIEIESGKIISTIKIDNDKISKPFVQNKNLFLIRDNAIIKLK